MVGPSVLVAVLLVGASWASDYGCYWDSDCSTTCCQVGQCLQPDVCNRMRNLPHEIYLACSINADCQTNCCSGYYCAEATTCDNTSRDLPLIILIVILCFLLLGLLVIVAYDKFQKK